jgi:hypothetical protein
MIKKIEQKIGEALDLKISHSKVWNTNSKGLSKAEHERELITMKEEPSKQQKEMEDCT